jgi:hypothetical protein
MITSFQIFFQFLIYKQATIRYIHYSVEKSLINEQRLAGHSGLGHDRFGYSVSWSPIGQDDIPARVI